MKYCYYSRLNVPPILEWDYDEETPNLIIAVGGDGTMLGAIHKYQTSLHDVKFIGVKKGNLGFFCGFEPNHLTTLPTIIDKKDFTENKYRLLKYQIFTDEDVIEGIAVNEVAITNPIHTQIIDVFIDNEKFETFRGTGLLICPPAGSTAYNKSLGGSIIDPLIPCMQMTEIAAINNNVYKALSSSLVLSEEKKLALVVSDADNLYISVDGIHLKTKNIKKIELSLAKEYVTIITKEAHFMQRVKESFL